MTTPEEVAAELNQLLSAEAPKKEDGPSIVLAPKLYLDRKILEENQTPRLMETVKDESGGILIRKYEKLTKAVWQKFRSKPECRPLHFVCEIPIFVIDDVNCSFLLPEDFQFLGALFNQWGNDSVADQFFTEALKTGGADANINAGVFRYRRGERGVMDNFYIAKKHFNKALGILHEAPLTVDEKHLRRKLCAAAIDEIDYRFASFLDKFIRFIIRLLTLRFETVVPYVGAAAPAVSPDARLRQLMDSILKKEFDLKKASAEKFLRELHEKIPAAQSHLESELAEIEAEYGGFPTPDLLEIGVSRIGEFYFNHLPILERRTIAVAEPSAAVPSAAEVVDIGDYIYSLAGADEIGNVAARLKLASVGELVDRLSKPVIDKPVLAWLLRDKFDQPEVMECLSNHPSLPDDIKRLIRRQHGLPGG